MNDLVLVLEDPLEGIEMLMGKVKDFGMLANSKVNNQKTKKLTKKMKLEDQIRPMKKTGLKLI